MMLFLDIHSRKEWPSCKLSNFADSPFSIDGMRYQCFEAFLQSLKDPFSQAEYQHLTAREAKERGSKIPWQTAGRLYWKGESFSRYDWHTYRSLLHRAYDAMLSANPETARALRATGHCLLWRSVGKWSRRNTCLTTFEFLHCIYRARRIARKQYKPISP